VTESAEGETPLQQGEGPEGKADEMLEEQ